MVGYRFVYRLAEVVITPTSWRAGWPNVHFQNAYSQIYSLLFSHSLLQKTIIFFIRMAPSHILVLHSKTIINLQPLRFVKLWRKMITLYFNLILCRHVKNISSFLLRFCFSVSKSKQSHTLSLNSSSALHILFLLCSTCPHRILPLHFHFLLIKTQKH